MPLLDREDIHHLITDYSMTKVSGADWLEGVAANART